MRPGDAVASRSTSPSKNTLPHRPTDPRREDTKETKPSSRAEVEGGLRGAGPRPRAASIAAATSLAHARALGDRAGFLEQLGRIDSDGRAGRTIMDTSHEGQPVAQVAFDGEGRGNVIAIGKRRHGDGLAPARAGGRASAEQ